MNDKMEKKECGCRISRCNCKYDEINKEWWYIPACECWGPPCSCESSQLLQDFKERMNKKLIDPYKITDKWLEFHPEDDYETYLKELIFHTDGEMVELFSSYKECPRSMPMSSGKYSILWMLPDKYDENNFPHPPHKSLKNKKDIGKDIINILDNMIVFLDELEVIIKEDE